MSRSTAEPLHTPREVIDIELLRSGCSAAYERDLLEYRTKRYIVGIQIYESEGNKCQFSSSYAGCYRLEDAPDFPFGPCGHEPEFYCLCFWTPVFEDDGVPDWKSPAHRHPLAGGRIDARQLVPEGRSAMRVIWEKIKLFICNQFRF